MAHQHPAIQQLGESPPPADRETPAPAWRQRKSVKTAVKTAVSSLGDKISRLPAKISSTPEYLWDMYGLNGMPSVGAAKMFGRSGDPSTHDDAVDADEADLADAIVEAVTEDAAEYILARVPGSASIHAVRTLLLEVLTSSIGCSTGDAATAAQKALQDVATASPQLPFACDVLRLVHTTATAAAGVIAGYRRRLLQAVPLAGSVSNFEWRPVPGPCGWVAFLPCLGADETVEVGGGAMPS